jgi:hypothetical protein
METAQAFRWVVTTAKADVALMSKATGGVHQGKAPIGTKGIIAQVTQQAESDTKTMQAVQVFARILLQIKGVGDSSSFDDIEIVADRIEALFGDQRNVPLSPGWVLNSHRETIVSYEEFSSGVQKSHLGGLYRVTLQGA